MSNLTPFEDLLKLRLSTLFASSCSLPVFTSDTPSVSVVIPVHSRPHLLMGSVEALATQGFASIEVIIVDNASDAETLRLLARIEGARIVRNSKNRYFLQGSNDGAAIARGEYLLLLNSDTFVCPGAISSALRVFERESVGAVGALLLNPSLTIQEYGGAILPNASTIPRHHGSSYSAHTVHGVPLSVDYCSGAFLLTPRALFQEMGGFDSLYSPAYYEDVDYCFRLAQRGLHTVVDPKVVAVHVGRGSADSTAEIDRQIGTNQVRFHHRHREALHSRWGTSTVKPAVTDRSVVFIDDVVPNAAAGQGQGRAELILYSLAQSGFNVSVCPMRHSSAINPGPWKVIAAVSNEKRSDLLERVLTEHSVAIVSRPANMELVYDVLSRVTMIGRARAHVIYDSEALQSRREMIRLQILHGTPLSSEEILSIVTREVVVACAADQTLAVSLDELDVYSNFGFPRCSLLSYGVQAALSHSAFSQRRGLLFVGSMTDTEGPNVDGLWWFIKHVHPQLLTKLSSEKGSLHVVGEVASGMLQDLSSSNVMFLGALQDLSPIYERYRVFVVPTRFGAGISLKTIEAAARGVPIVASSLVASQLGWRDEEELLIARNDQEFAEKCCRLHEDEALWSRLRTNALARVAEQFSLDTFREALGRIMARAT